jgi:hypothetical protein
MPKTVAEKTRHLSFRIDVVDEERIEQIRSAMEQRFGIFPQRSDVLRKVLDYGIASFCSQNNILLKDHSAEGKKAVPKKPATPAAKKPAAPAAKKSAAPAAKKPATPAVKKTDNKKSEEIQA